MHVGLGNIMEMSNEQFHSTIYYIIYHIFKLNPTDFKVKSNFTCEKMPSQSEEKYSTLWFCRFKAFKMRHMIDVTNVISTKLFPCSE